LRVGEHLDFSEQLNKLKEAREEHQRAHESLARVEETHEEIVNIHDEIEKRKTDIEKITGVAKEFQTDLEETKTSISNTQQEVENEAQTINERYETVLKKTDQINDYEERLEDSLSEIEARSERLDEQETDINQLSDQISDLLNGAIAASLDRNFTDQKEELESGVRFWKWSTFVAIGVLIGFAVYIFQDITQVSEFGIGTVSRATLLLPALIGVWFTSKNYSRQRKLMEEYTFKATLAQTLEPSRDVLESQLTSDGSDEQLAEFMVASMGQIFQNPSEIVDDNGSNDDDATYVESVRDLSQRIAGRDSN
jgi:DNA repair exonuclease SbcCD ATPase subunit